MANPPASPRLIAIDLDGTLLRSDGSVSARTRSALSGAVEAGIQLVMVTGRPARHVREIDSAGHFGDLAICLNGALVYDLGRHAVAEHQCVSVRALQPPARSRIHCAPCRGVPPDILRCGVGHYPAQTAVACGWLS